MKKNIFLLAGLLLLSSINIWAEDDDYICLDGQKDTILATSLTVTPDTFEIPVGGSVQLTITKLPENALLDTIYMAKRYDKYSNDTMLCLSPDGLVTVPDNVNHLVQRDGGVFDINTRLSNLTDGNYYIVIYENYTYNGHVPEYVELAGIKWATSNVGTDSPEEIGKYFMYGNTVGYTQEEFVADNSLYVAGGYTLSNFQSKRWGDGADIRENQSYTPGDRRYDAATVNKGLYYVIPTYEQWNTLITSSDIKVVNIDGRFRRFEGSTSQRGIAIIKNGTNGRDGQFIFLPSAGKYLNTTLTDGTPYDATSCYWSTKTYKALEFAVRDVTNNIVGWDKRFCAPKSCQISSPSNYIGLPIRPVYRECNPFSVGDNQYVEFSKGNAQYNSKTSTWKFADYQNSIIGNTSSDWTDLHLWNANFSSLGSEWRMLSNDEWKYLLGISTNQRKNATALRSAATVGGVPGLIILPDNWEWPAEIDESKRWTTGSNNTSSYSFSTDWDEMEEAGAIFLPIAGMLNKKSELQNTTKAYYWTSDKNGNDKAYYFYLEKNKDNNLTTQNNGVINESHYSIRLVKDL